MIAGRIRHTAAFTLAYAEGSAGERDFLEAADGLAAVPGVGAFELLAEVSPKNGYRFGISMEFADRAAYDGYKRAPGRRALPAGALVGRGERAPRVRPAADRGGPPQPQSSPLGTPFNRGASQGSDARRGSKANGEGV